MAVTLELPEMANDEDIARLRQGVTVWNAWRKEKFRNVVDLNWANLGETDLRDVDLFNADLHGANLYKANLSGACLIMANLSGVCLEEAVLEGAHLSEAKITNHYGSLKEALPEAELEETASGDPNIKKILEGIVACSQVNLTKANLYRAGLMKADLRDAKLVRADLRSAVLHEANLSYADLTGANLSGASLEFATLIRTNFTHADLISCRVYGVSAWDLELEGARQRDLVITLPNQPLITVDDIEVSQFIYLLKPLRNGPVLVFRLF